MPEPDVILETPGDSATATASFGDPEAAQAPEPPPAASEPPPDTPSTVAEKEASLREQLIATAHLVGSPAALNWDHLTGAAAVKVDYKPIGPELPDQLDVDPHTITAPVLSKQGWVLPINDRRAR